MLLLLDVNLNTSGIHQVVAGCVYSAMFAALWVASVNAIITLLLSMMIGVHAFIYFKRFILCEVDAVRFYQEGWRVRHSGQWQKAWPVGQAVVNGCFISLSFQVELPEGSKRLGVIIFPDSASARHIHALRLNIVLNGFGSNRYRK